MTARAVAFARRILRQVAHLALVKLGADWCPWPRGEIVRAPALNFVSAIVTIPIYLLMLAGLWDRRRDLRALVLLAGPVCYFAAIHVVFVSSIRYRLPGMVPAFGMVGIAVRKDRSS